MADTAAINSPDYWNRRFALDWTARGGAEQTSFFAGLAVSMSPEWFWRDAKENALSLIDIGCALGEALPDFKARLPKSKLSGADVSDVAIRMAKERLPDFGFHVIAADWSDAPKADIVFCSNTLEHLSDWRARLDQLGELSDKYVLVLVPFQERDLIEEHVASFDFESFPAALPGGKRLLFFRIEDATHAPDSHWPGHQALALYGPKSKPKRSAPPINADAYTGVDLRGLKPVQIEAVLGSLRTRPSLPLAAQSDRAETQNVVDRINEEWRRKVETTTAEFMAKHAETRAHYERLIAERDAMIAEQSELGVWRKRAQVLEEKLQASTAAEIERLSRQLKDSEDRREAGAAALLAATLESARAKLVDVELDRERNQNTALNQEIAIAKTALQALQKEHVALRREVEVAIGHEKVIAEQKTLLASKIADVAAAKSALRCVMEERDEARRQLLQLPIVEPATQTTSSAERGVWTAASGNAAELARLLNSALADVRAHEGNVHSLRAHYEAHLRELNGRLAQFGREMEGVLDGVRTAWHADLGRASGRAMSEQNYAQVLREQLTRVLQSKSWAIAARIRRAFWLARGVNAELVTVPEAPPPIADAASNFLHNWDLAKGVLFQIAGDTNPAGASEPVQISVAVTPTISPDAAQNAASAMAAPLMSGRVVAMQAVGLGNGGLERVVFDLAVGLSARGIKVVVLCVSNTGVFVDELRRRGIVVHEIQQNEEEYEHILRQEKVTELFLHHSYFGLERAARVGLKIFDVVHNYYFWHRDAAQVVKRASDLCTKIIYVSSAVRAFHEGLFGVSHDKGVVINNPAHLDGLIVPEKAQLRRLRDKSEDVVFLNVAQAFPSKAQAAMVTAFARACRARGGMRLKIAGAPVKEDAARVVKERIAEEGVGDVVEVLGHCDRRAMSGLYAQSHAFVLPSIYEGYSVSAIEAATYGLPLIMTAVGGAQDLIENGGCGILLPPPIADLGSHEPSEVERIGLMHENNATEALERAFIDITDERTAWTARGLDARFNVHSLEYVVGEYAGLMSAISGARR